VVEIAQLFVFSRTTDTTDTVTAALGAGVGARLVSTQALHDRGGHVFGRLHPFTWSLLGLALWSAALMLVFWYPYDFHLERQFLLARVGAFSKVPFSTYYFGTEYRAVTELLHKVLFFAPLGVLLALGRRRLPRGLPRGLYWPLAIAITLGLPLLIELGQVALPGKYPDNTDWLLEVMGCVLGLVATRSIQRRLRSSGP